MRDRTFWGTAREPGQPEECRGPRAGRSHVSLLSFILSTLSPLLGDCHSGTPSSSTFTFPGASSLTELSRKAGLGGCFSQQVEHLQLSLQQQLRHLQLAHLPLRPGSQA